MKLIQDILVKEVDYLRTDIGLDSIRFKHSSVEEFKSDLRSLNKIKRYPFFFINADTIEYDLEKPDNIIVSAGEIVLATTFRGDATKYSSEMRDDKVFRPILTPLLNGFLYRMDYASEIAIFKAGRIRYQYRYGSDAKSSKSDDVLDDAVCAIQLLNFQFRILTIKNDSV